MNNLATNHDWSMEVLEELAPLNAKRRYRCFGCHNLIEIGEMCAEIERTRQTFNAKERSEFGDEKPLASKYYCEKCSHDI